ncbi:hypothetical protein D5S17_04070 [Pseudonocardiaceae bacterium YIM PH 21723]|nr:hypothetical protein D5S17_04070 [Pseudonocardiaceae bacterium YIM PH 21723]
MQQAMARKGTNAYQVARVLKWDEVKIYKAVYGTRPLSPLDVIYFHTRCGTPIQKIKDLVSLAQQQHSTRWLITDADPLSASDVLRHYQATAGHVISFSYAVLPPELRVSGYAEALADAVTARLRLISTRPGACAGASLDICGSTGRLYFIDEAAIRRPVGGPDLMHEQLCVLLHVAAHPHITIRLLPTDTAWHPDDLSAFEVFHLRNGMMVHIPAGGAHSFLDDESSVSRHLRHAADLDRYARSTEDSIALIADQLARLDRHLKEINPGTCSVPTATDCLRVADGV